jgi:hypothetical protein
MIKGEKLPIVSVVLLAMLDVKLSGNVIIVSIIRRVQSPYILAIQTLSFRYHRYQVSNNIKSYTNSKQ